MLCLAAYAKINWTLDILGTRPDGYHLMDMLMQTVSLCDLLWMEEAEDLTLEAVPGGTERAARSKTNDGLSSAGVRYYESNLVYRAALLLRERCGVRRGARIQLEKRIPSGAGMGGGSADCAAALKGLNALWGLGLSRAELLSLGLKLGADVPFLITGGLARVGGIGERIQPLLPAPQVWLVLVQPCEGLSTREVFSAFDRLNPARLRHPDNAAAQDALHARETELTGRQTALTEQQQQLTDQITALRMDAASIETARAASENTIAQLQALSEAMQGDVTQKTGLIHEYELQISALEGQIQEKEDGLTASGTQLDLARQTLKEAVDERAQLEARRSQTEKQAQEKNQSILQLERETARLEQKKATSELEEKQIVDKLWDSYELTPGTAEKETVEIENLTAANKRITEVRRKISALGTPNLGAIDEYARVSERYEYLTAQRDDVQHAKSELETIVASITTEMTEIFVREFARIDEYFGKTFAEMFGGGKASLILEDKSAPLECGIEIRVQPPGKQVKTITLLSGGEKAFVAIALYFAILKVRPTPFCMLDEIDAALDDRNVERFANYLHTLSDKTQFIVITHRRGTMEAADVLYGVTMQEQGVSKILRLSLDELAKQLGVTN